MSDIAAALDPIEDDVRREPRWLGSTVPYAIRTMRPTRRGRSLCC
jgi:hypothetical protein